MTAKHRPNPKTAEQTFRVYKLDEQTREAFKAERIKRGFTNATMLKTAVINELPKIADAIKALGIRAVGKKTRPARLPLDADVLYALQYTAQETGLDQSMLLAAAIRVACTGKASKPARKTRRAAK
jgi:hypothetical protein